MPASPSPDEPSLFAAAEQVYRYARRWAVGQSPNPEDAVVYDAAVLLLNEHFAPNRLGSPSTANAVHDRYLRNGHETITNTFTIPIAATDAVVILHRFARRYTNGRGSYTASIVNQVARDLLSLGIPLDATVEADGTCWAADGADGAHDGLTVEQRAEALAALHG